MADLTQHPSDAGLRAGKVRAKKMSTKIDMTPMVDLAFLLLTFFILTSSFMKPLVMPLTMPDKVEDPTLLPQISDDDVLNLAPGKNNDLFWWNGVDKPVHKTDYSRNGLRKLLLNQLRANPQIMVLIKPASDSNFQNMIDVLDEIQITSISRYAIVDLTESEEKRMR